MLSKILTRGTRIQLNHHRYVHSIGIRREDKSRWERRSALTPDMVEKLIQETGSKVYIQPSTKRIFPNEQFQKVYK